jgi:uncharacterized membrane protein YfcA
MIGLGIGRVFAAASYDNATLSERSELLLVGILGVALGPTGAVVALWSEASLLVRACGLITAAVGVLMIWSVVGLIMPSTFQWRSPCARRW